MQILRGHFDVMYETRKKDFANARTVRKFFEAMIEKQSERIAKMGGTVSRADLINIIPADLPIGQ